MAEEATGKEDNIGGEKLNRNDIEQALRDYHWMPKEVDRIQSTLNEVDTSVTAAYGVEASLPKPKGQTSDKVGNEVVRRDKQHRYLIKIKGKIRAVEQMIDHIKDDRDKAVLFCLLDGMSQTQISLHLGLSESKVSKIKNNLVEQIYAGLKGMKENTGMKESTGNTGMKEKCTQKKKVVC
ncbi:DNA-binding response regulator [Shouchella tritolerans]|uniref:DNA-binding response regulator n=1 Tax=Shouchella tritolerans TaxID=2979466 RepID=UPI0021E8C3E9|nr:DNA-binding response regulator [Shouchella tritolerans]